MAPPYSGRILCGIQVKYAPGGGRAGGEGVVAESGIRVGVGMKPTPRGQLNDIRRGLPLVGEEGRP